MRLQAVYLIGALAVTTVPLAAGAQSLPANDRGADNARAVNQVVPTCAAGWVWEHGGYAGAGTWRPPHCASRSRTVDF
jgi:hypothetical protein